MKQSPFVVSLRYSLVLQSVLVMVHVAPVLVACLTPVSAAIRILVPALACVSAVWSLHAARGFSRTRLRFGADGNARWEDSVSGHAQDVWLLPECRDLGGMMVLLCWQDASGGKYRFTFLRDGLARDDWRSLRRVVRWTSGMVNDIHRNGDA